MYSPSVLGNPCTNALEHAELLCCLIKVLQALEVRIVSGAVVLNCERDVCPRASHPLIYATLNLSRTSVTTKPAMFREWNLLQSALMPERAVGTVWTMYDAWYLCQSCLQTTLYWWSSVWLVPWESHINHPAEGPYAIHHISAIMTWTSNSKLLNLNAKLAPSFNSSANVWFFLVAVFIWLLWKLNITSTRGQTLALSSPWSCEPRIVICIQEVA